MRDPKTEEFKELIGHGAKVKMDESGNILLKRLSSSQVFVKNPPEDSAVSNDVMKLPQGLVDVEKPFRVFDMRKFQQNVNRELRRTNPDRLRYCCYSRGELSLLIMGGRGDHKTLQLYLSNTPHPPPSTVPGLYNNDNLLPDIFNLSFPCHFRSHLRQWALSVA